MSRVQTSFVWSFFEKTEDKKHALCGLCNQSLKYLASTSNLRQHIIRKHRLHYEKYINDNNISIPNGTDYEEITLAVSNINETSNVTDVTEADDYNEEHIDESNLKRKRTQNFSQKETILLCNLLEPHAAVLDMSKSDLEVMQMKNQVWCDVTAVFNETTDGIKRTPMQLKGFLENLKKKKRKELLISEGNASGESNSLSIYKHHLTRYCIEDFINKHSNCDESNFTITIENDSLNNDDGSLNIEPGSFINERLPTSEANFDNLIEYNEEKLEFLQRQREQSIKEHDMRMRIFLLQEEKLKLEIREIKERLFSNANKRRKT